MGLDAEQREPPLHGGVRDALGIGQGARAPVRAVLGLVAQRPVDDLRNALVVVGARTSRAKFVVQSLHPVGEEPAPPLADRLWRRAHASRHFRVGDPFGAGEDHAGTRDQRMRQAGGSGGRLQLVALLIVERQWRERASTGHNGLPAN